MNYVHKILGKTFLSNGWFFLWILNKKTTKTFEMALPILSINSVFLIIFLLSLLTSIFNIILYSKNKIRVLSSVNEIQFS